MQEKINDEVQYNQIRITIRGSDQLRNADANYIKFYLCYDNQQNRKRRRDFFEGHYYTNDTEPKEFFHTLKSSTNTFDNVWKKLKDCKVDFKLKKSHTYRFWLKDIKEEKSISLASLNAKSVIEKDLTLEGAKISVQIMVHKSTKTKEMVTITSKEDCLGELVKPFRQV